MHVSRKVEDFDSLFFLSESEQMESDQRTHVLRQNM